MPNPPKATKKKSRLSRLSKRSRDAIARVMEERDGHLSLADFLAKRWVIETVSTSPFTSDQEVAERAAKRRTQWALLHPELTPNQIETAISMAQLTNGLLEAAIARRVTLDDPAELARGLATITRIDRTLCGRSTTDYLSLCSLGDVSGAQRLVAGVRAGLTAIPDDYEVRQIAEIAILQNDAETLRLATREMPHRKVRPWLQGIYTCLTGVAEQQPSQVATGLDLFLNGSLNERERDELSEAINLDAQGLYRICEWVSPELVAAFDVARPFPWDAEFHAWCQDHPDPLDGIDLTGISAELHETVVLGKPPAWLMLPARKLYEIVLTGGDPKDPRLLQLIEGCAGTTKSSLNGKQLLARRPVVLRWNLDQADAETFRRHLFEAGGAVEIRVMSPTPFRFCYA